MYIKNVEGVYLVSENGFGYVRPFLPCNKENEFDNNDIFIPPTQTGGAFGGDIVSCTVKSISDTRNNLYTNGSSVFVLASREFSYVGKVVSVQKRLRNVISGNVIAVGKKLYLMPDDYVRDRVLLSGGGVPAADGDKVIARISSITSEGSVKAVAEKNLGSSALISSNFEAIMLSHSITADFSKEAANQTDKFCMEQVSRFANRRLDLRGRTLFTMEGFGKYAYSCAFSVDYDENDNYVLGIHVPDVAHYIPEDSALDKEAAKRGRSCNLMGKTYHMVPKELMEKKLSMKKGVDVLAVSFMLTINVEGEVVDVKFDESIINVSANCTNAEMEALLLNADTSALSDVRLLYKPVKKILDRAYALGALLQSARIQKGGLDVDEYRNRFVYVEENDKPIELKRLHQNDPNRLVNEFYLICERAMGEFFAKHNIPTIYYGFVMPSKVKLAEIETYARNLGMEMLPCEDEGFLQHLCSSVMGTPVEEVVFEKISHSLANLDSEILSVTPVFNFIHNTDKASPLCFPSLRYADLAVQRIVKKLVGVGLDNVSDSKLSELCGVSFEAVKTSVVASVSTNNAEQECYDLFNADYCRKNIGKTFEGYLSAIGEMSASVLLGNGCVGDILFSYYKNASASRDGKSAIIDGKEYALGQEVSVAVVEADVGGRAVKFVFA